MRIRKFDCLLAAAVGAALLATGSEAALGAAQPFDGGWTVAISCAEAADGAKAYEWRFPAEVRGGMLQGRYGEPGAINWATISGRIGANGGALLQVKGATGAPDYSVGRVKPGNPIHYTVNAHFDERSGSGKRNELRPCDLTF